MFRVLLFLSAFSVWGATAQAVTYTFTSNPYSFFTYSGAGPGESYQLRGPNSVNQNLTFRIELENPSGPDERLFFGPDTPMNAGVFDGINTFTPDGRTTPVGTISTGSAGQISSWDFNDLGERGGGGFDTFRSFVNSAGVAITEVGYDIEHAGLFVPDQPGVLCSVVGACLSAGETATAIGGTWIVSPSFAPVPVSGSAAFLGGALALGLLVAHRRRRTAPVA